MRTNRLLKLAKAVLATKLMIHNAMPYRLNVNITNLCNSRCRTCNVWKIYKEIDNGYTPDDELRVEEYEKVFKSLPSLLWFNFAGGEPFLRRDMPQIVEVAARNCKSLLVADTSTNGLNPELVEKTVLEILENVHGPLFSVGVSLDGAPALHDYIRGVRGNWDKAIRTYKRLREVADQYENFDSHINYTISNLNAGSIQSFFDALIDEGLNVELNDISISIAHSGLVFINENMESVSPAIKPAQSDINMLLSLRRDRGLLNPKELRVAVKEVFLKLARDKYLVNPSQMVLPCSATFASCYIDPYGIVFPCTIWNRPIGNLRKVDFDLSKIWFSDNMETVRKQVRQARCPNCWSGCESWTTLMQAMPWCFFKS